MAIRKKKVTAKSKITKVKERVQKLISKVKKKKPLMILEKAKPLKKIPRPIRVAPVAREEKRAEPYMRPFPPGVSVEQRPLEKEELPSGYGETKIVLLVRDPWWVHAYWEITEDKKTEMKHEIGLPWGEIRKFLRVYDVTGVRFDGTNALSFFDIEINDFANNWYINAGKPDRSWCVEIGAKDQKGRFHTIARSNTVSTPRDTVSWITDEEWMLAEEEFRKMYALSGGFRVGATSPVGIKKEKVREMMRMEFGSGALMSPVKVKVGAKPFWLVVNTELILYGATEPDAKVTVQGKQIQLNKDGSFSLRFALPDGKQTIPVKAVSADEKDERTITPVVIKETK